MKIKNLETNIYTFRTIIEPDKPYGYHGFVPLLRGIHTQGKNIEEVKRNLKEAIICHLQGLMKDKEQIPYEEEAMETIQTILPRELILQK